MKKIACSLAALVLLASGARADEGMWLLPLLKQMNAKPMAELGLQLSPEEIYDKTRQEELWKRESLMKISF